MYLRICIGNLEMEVNWIKFLGLLLQNMLDEYFRNNKNVREIGNLFLTVLEGGQFRLRVPTDSVSGKR